MGKIFTFLTAFMLLMAFSLVKAQSNSEQGTVIPLAGHDSSIELKDITPIPPSGTKGEIENQQDWGEDPFGKSYSQPPANDPVVQTKKGTKETKSAAINFEGLSNSDNTGSFHAPPDTDGDIGPNHYFQATNTAFEIFDRDGNSLYGPADVTTIFNGFTGEWTGLGVSDPIVLYDEQADRWFFSIFTTDPGTTTGNYYILIAISQTPDPTGSYYRYAYGVSAMPDYAKWAVWPNGYFMGANVHSGLDVFAFNRSDLLVGTGSIAHAYDNPDRPNYSSSFHAVLPADCDGPFPPSSTPAYFVTINDDAWPNNSTDKLMIWEFSADWSTSSFSWTLVQSITVAAFDTYFTGGFHDNIEQPGTAQKLDAISQILMNRVNYRYIGGQGRIVCNHTVDVDTDHAGVRWYELRKTGSNPWVKYQESTYAPDADNRWMGSISMNENGDIALGFSVSSSSTYPSIRFTGRNSSDALNSMTVAEQSIYDGAYSQTTGSRWGDYSTMRVDVNDGQTFWYSSEYVSSSSGWYPWSTRIAAFSFNSYCAATATSCGSSDEYISRVQFGNIDNNTGCDHYTDYSTMQINEIPINAAENITVTNGHPWAADQCGIWVDWNNDGDFTDAGETISVSGTPGNGPYTALIDPPSTVSVGDELTMRVRIVYNTTPSACGTTTYGEVEDYGILIGDAVPNVWTGNFNNYWGNAANWSLNHIPTSSEDVEIPNVNMPCIVDYSDKTCHDITIYSGATVNINNSYALNVTGDVTVAGAINLTNTSARLNVDGYIDWQAGSTGSLTASARIKVQGYWIFESGANVQFTSGYVEFLGSSTSYIRSYESNCQFENVVNNKVSSTLAVSAMSTDDLHIAGNIYNYSGCTFGSYSSHSIILDGFFNNLGGNIHCASGTFVFNGNPSVALKPNTGDYFNNLYVSLSSGSLSLDNTYSSELHVNGDMLINGGTLIANDFDIYIGGDWTNTVGTAGFDEGTSRVIFNGGNYHQYCSDETFNELEVNKPLGGAFRIQGTDVVCAAYDWTAGAVDVLPGASTFTANDLIDNGIYGAFYLNPGGTINLTNNDGYVDLDGELHIFGGTMNVYGGTSDSYWPWIADASITMSDGVLDFHDRGINIHNTSTYTLTENITGGTIRTSQGFSGNRADFTPSAGTFEFYGSSDYYISQSNGCTLFDVNIDKSTKNSNTTATGQPVIDERSKEVLSPGSKSNTILLSSDFVITNELTVTAGELTLNGHELSVAHDCNVYGTLNMTNNADVLNSGTTSYDQLYFENGSTGNITNGNIYLAWGIIVYPGSSFTATTANTIHYNSSVFRGGISNGDPNTVFGNIEVNKPSGYFQIWNDFSEPIVVNGDFTLTGTQFEMQNFTMIVHGNFIDNSTAETYLYDAISKSSGKESGSDGKSGQSSGKSKGGYLELDNDFTLNGLLDVGDGDVLAHGLITQQSSGILTISGGTYSCDASSGFNSLYGTYNFSDGLMEFTSSHIRFYGTPNITGGIVRAGRTVVASDGGFQQNGGTFEFVGSTTGNYIQFNINNYINDFLFNRTANYIIYPANTAPDFIIKGNVTINSGTFSSNGNDIYVGGDWANNSGSSAFNETSAKVVFDGANSADILTGETFYNLVLDKTYVGFDGLELADGITVNVLGDFNALDGDLEMNSNSTLNVAGDVHLAAGGGLNAYSDYGLEITVGGDFVDDNTSNNTLVGYSPGDEVITFNGTGDQYITTAAPQEEFGNLVIDKSSGEFKPNDSIYVHHDFTLTNGTWSDNVNGLSHYFEEDFLVNGGEFSQSGNKNTVNFVSDKDANVYFTATPTNGIFNKVNIDKSTITKSGSPEGGKDEKLIEKGETNPEAKGGSKSQIVTLTSDVFCGYFAGVSIQNGTLDLNGYMFTSTGDLNVNSNGILYAGAGSTLRVGQNQQLNVNNGGQVSLIGTSGSNVHVTHYNPAYYKFNVKDGGTLSAEFTTFEYIDFWGLYFQMGSTLDPAHALDYCTFQNVEVAGGSSDITFENDQTVTATGVNFPDNPYFNVYKSNNAGDITFADATGDYAGPEYEYDPNGRVHWSDIDVELGLTVMLEGPYNGSGMNTDLNSLGLIPLSQPFNSNSSADWYYTGTESVASIPPNVVDWVLVQIRDASNVGLADESTVVAEQAAFLLNDGSIVDLDGSSNLLFSGISYSSGLYPVVWHRNHLGVISSARMTRTGGVYSYDFTAAGSAYSNSNAGETDLGGGVYGLWGGDGNGSGWVYNTEDLTYWRNKAGTTGYKDSDYNLDGQVENRDKNDIWVDSYNKHSQIPESKKSSSDDTK